MFNNPYNMYYGNQISRIGNIGATPRMAGINSTGGFVNGIGSGKPGFFKSLTSIKWGSVLNNTQKTLNVINQAIPVYYQMKPIFGNLKSLGKIMSAFNEPDNNTNQVNDNRNRNQMNNQIVDKEKKEENMSLPTFFIN